MFNNYNIVQSNDLLMIMQPHCINYEVWINSLCVYISYSASVSFQKWMIIFIFFPFSILENTWYNEELVYKMNIHNCRCLYISLFFKCYPLLFALVLFNLSCKCYSVLFRLYGRKGVSVCLFRDDFSLTGAEHS